MRIDRSGHLGCPITHLQSIRATTHHHDSVIHILSSLMKDLGVAVRSSTNILILLLAPAPSVLYCWYCSRGCNNISARGSQLCRSCNLNPLALLNALFFVNVCGAFWILGLLQRSAWVSDRPLLYSMHKIAKCAIYFAS